VVREQISEPFFTTKGVDRGTGLGLSIVYGIVQQHGGEIRVSSVPGKGATFRTLFPLIAEPAENAPPPEPEPPLPGGAGAILVVDNEEGIRDYLSQFLTTLGYQVVTAKDGDEASWLFQTRRFDLVLMDAVMPKKNGKEAAREIRQVDPGARILFMSGYPFDENSAGSLLPENAQVIRKPLAPSELAQKVRAVLES
jgi:CheY-like chemotaxis protein